MKTPDKRFHESIFRTVHGRWPKDREFSEWCKRLKEFDYGADSFAIDKIRDARYALEDAGLEEYAREVYWTSIALLMKKHDEEENRDE